MAAKKGTPQDWGNCAGREAVMSLRDEVIAVRDDYRLLSENVNKLTVGLAVYTEHMDNVIMRLDDHNERQNGSLQKTAESLEAIKGKMSEQMIWGISGFSTLSVLLLLVIMGVKIDVIGFVFFVLRKIGFMA